MSVYKRAFDNFHLVKKNIFHVNNMYKKNH